MVESIYLQAKQFPEILKTLKNVLERIQYLMILHCDSSQFGVVCCCKQEFKTLWKVKLQ